MKPDFQGFVQRKGGDIDDVISRAMTGDDLAWAELLKTVGPVVERVVRARSPRGLSEDWLHEVMVRFLTGLPQYRRDAPLENWAARVAVAVCQDLHRQRLRQKRNGPVTAFIQHELIAPQQPDTLSNREFVEQLLDQLDAENREVLIMLDIEQRPVNEIAELLGRTAAWVKVRAHRARELLRDWAARRGLGPTK